MSTRCVLLCPGQGAQRVGMGKPWFDAAPVAAQTFAAADALLGDRLGAPLSEICFQGPEDRVNRTDVAQPAIFVSSAACWQALTASEEGDGLTPVATAGLSLGEYTALHLAGAISFNDCLELVALRGRAMQEAAEASKGGMVALIGADEAQARTVCDQAAGGEVLVPANFNAPGQIVLSGHASACERAVEIAGPMGLRASLLPVAGAFHSPLMAPAGERLAKALEQVEITEPQCTVVSNVTALPHGEEPGEGESVVGSIKRRLVEQLTAPVRWDASCAWLVANVAESREQMHELAPGKVLTGLMRRIDKSVKVINHDEPSQPS
ncbi:MAG: ACP S-malonyltransferase [Phycisphaerales bacterium]|nr:MAG: ACP S-malonyltransferase [Phycisphaerales bacterium]